MTGVDVYAGIEEAELLAAVRAICTAKEWLYVEQRLQGKKVAEIAAQIGVHPNAIYRRKARLRKKVESFLKKINFEGGKNRGSIR